MGRKEYESRTEELLKPIVDSLGLRIYDVEYVKEGSDYYLRAYIDKDGGVTIDDCEAVSRALNVKLDEEDYVKDAYILEVSSPGLGRQLKKDKDFKRSLGEKVECKLFKAINKQKEFEGILKDFTEETITLEVDETELIINRKEIAMIRLAIDF